MASVLYLTNVIRFPEKVKKQIFDFVLNGKSVLLIQQLDYGGFTVIDYGILQIVWITRMNNG